ncbi:MAG: YicC family protein [Symbiobacteriaceae bacterium]
MLRSMTGYGRGEAEEGGLRVRAEVRTVNHRYLDIAVRLPDAFLFLEEPVRRQVSARLSRGRVGVHLTFEDAREKARPARINTPLLNAYAEAAEAVRQRFFPDREPDLRWLLAVPDLFAAPSPDEDASLWACAAERAVADALEAVIAMREREGALLAADLAERLDRLESLRSAALARAPQVVEEYRQRLVRRLSELLPPTNPVDPQRLAQEVALFAERADITEELQRLASHIDQFRRALRSDEAVGRKLDFLVQEMGREWNTIGSKANDAELAALVVEAKSELEKIREQVQNLE